MKRVALGLALALVLAAFPIGNAATAAGSASVRFINGKLAGAQTIDIYVDGVKKVNDLALASSSDVALDPGNPNLLNACPASSTSVDGGGVCQPGGVNIGAVNQDLTLSDGGNYTIVVIDPGIAAPAYVFTNDTSATGLGEFRYTVHSAIMGVTTFDVCIDGVKVVTALAAGATADVDVTAAQGANYSLFVSAAGCATPVAQINFVAGTNFVQTIGGTTNPTCAAACVQILFVGQGRVPNVPSTQAFCTAVLGLATVSGDLKALIGSVDPTSTATILATEPSHAAMKAFADGITAKINAGDAVVPAAIKPAWETATSGLRQLVQTFQLIGYELSVLPPSVVQAMVLGANGISIPGVPPNQDLVAATAALTTFFTTSCIAAPVTPPATPTTAPAAASTVKFTG